MHDATQKLHQQPWALQTIMTRNLDALIKDLSSNHPNIFVAAINSSTQILITGFKEFLSQLNSSHVLKVISMNAAGAPFHSPLLLEASKQFEKHLNSYLLDAGTSTTINVISNVTATPFPKDDKAIISSLLRDQIIKTVQWKSGMEYLINHLGINSFLFTGPGRILYDVHKREYPQYHSSSSISLEK